MTSWDELVTTALIGTDRRLLPEVTAPDGTALSFDTNERRLLAASAVLGPWRAAGRSASHDAVVPAMAEVAPPDDRPPCTPHAVQLLELLISPGTTFGDATALVDQWLRGCAGARRRLPHHLLVPLLSRATSQPDLRAAVVPVLDQRGRWLAAHQPGWSWAAAAADPAIAGSSVGSDLDPDTATWATATRAERVEGLGAWRARRPEAARAWLEGELGRLNAGERAELVATLAVGISDADEPLLDALLDDRAKGVRAVAAALLDRRPSSRRARRLADHLVPLIHRTGIARTRLEVELPGAHDPALDRDLPGDGRDELSMVPVAARQLSGRDAAGGARAARLQRLIAGAPLTVWEGLGIGPDRLVVHALEQRDLLIGVVAAALAQGDGRVATALFERLPLPVLVPLVDPERAADALEQWITRSSEGELPAVLLTAVRLPAPWSKRLSDAVITRLAALPVPAVVGQFRAPLGSHLDLGVIPAVEAWIEALAGDDKAFARRHVGQLHQTLSMRQAIDDAFAPA